MARPYEKFGVVDTMVKPELGAKRVCVSCGARFYDLKKNPAVCPKCDTEQPVEQPRLRRVPGNVAEDKRVPKKVVPVAEDVDLEADTADVDVDVDVDEDEDVLEDTSDLDDDDGLETDLGVVDKD